MHLAVKNFGTIFLTCRWSVPQNKASLNDQKVPLARAQKAMITKLRI